MAEYEITYYYKGEHVEMEDTQCPTDAHEMITVAMNVGVVDTIHTVVTSNGDYEYSLEHVRVSEGTNTWFTFTNTPHVFTLTHTL